MCRLVAWVSDQPRTLAEVLGSEALARLRHLATVHADGWGAAWHDEAGALLVQHSADSAAADQAFSVFAEGMASRSALVHLRLGTPGYGYGAASGHPFVDGPFAFAHNGAIQPGSAIDGLLAQDGRRRPHGPTDSERYFLAVRDEMEREGVGRVRDVTGAVDTVADRMAAHGLVASSLNALMLGPDALHVVCRHDADWQPSDIPVWPADLLAPVPAYFPMSCRTEAGTVTVVSSGIVEPGPPWADLPNEAVVTVDLASREATVSRLRAAAV